MRATWSATRHDDGRLGRQEHGIQIDGVNVIATSFALLFLSKGRTPVLISKLAYGDFAMPDGKMLVERGAEPGVVGWNRKHNDTRHLVEFASQELFNGLPLAWQVYDPRRKRVQPQRGRSSPKSAACSQSPVLYLNGHRQPVLTGQQKEILKKYVEEGGFVLAEACCGGQEFADRVPGADEGAVPGQQARGRCRPSTRSGSRSSPSPPTDFPELEVLERGCRTVVVFSPSRSPGTGRRRGSWPRRASRDANRGEQAFRLAANVIAYATGTGTAQAARHGRPDRRGTANDAQPAEGVLQAGSAPTPRREPAGPGRDAEPDGAPAERRPARRRAGEGVDLRPATTELFKYKFMYLHGRKRSWQLTDDEIENLKIEPRDRRAAARGRGCCGKREFDESFRATGRENVPGPEAGSDPADDELYSSEKLNGGGDHASVKRREKAGEARPRTAGSGTCRRTWRESRSTAAG